MYPYTRTERRKWLYDPVETIMTLHWQTLCHLPVNLKKRASTKVRGRFIQCRINHRSSPIGTHTFEKRPTQPKRSNWLLVVRDLKASGAVVWLIWLSSTVKVGYRQIMWANQRRRSRGYLSVTVSEWPQRWEQHPGVWTSILVSCGR